MVFTGGLEDAKTNFIRKLFANVTFQNFRGAGLLAHTFTKTGVYEISDLNQPEFKCVVLCKPASKQHVIRISSEEFSPGNDYNFIGHV